MHRFYLGLAFEMFVLRVTLLPQSCRSAPLSPQMLSPPLSLSAPVSLAACLLPLPALLPPLCLLMWVSDVAQLLV